MPIHSSSRFRVPRPCSNSCPNINGRALPPRNDGDSPNFLQDEFLQGRDRLSKKALRAGGEPSLHTHVQPRQPSPRRALRQGGPGPLLVDGVSRRAQPAACVPCGSERLAEAALPGPPCFHACRTQAPRAAVLLLQCDMIPNSSTGARRVGGSAESPARNLNGGTLALPFRHPGVIVLLRRARTWLKRWGPPGAEYEKSRRNGNLRYPLDQELNGHRDRDDWPGLPAHATTAGPPATSTNDPNLNACFRKQGPSTLVAPSQGWARVGRLVPPASSTLSNVIDQASARSVGAPTAVGHPAPADERREK